MKKIGRMFASVVKRIPVVFVYQLSKWVPKNKNLIIFGGENGKAYRGNTKYLFEEITKIENLQSVWITKNKETIKQIRDQNQQAYYHRSLKGMVLQLRASTAVHSHSIHDDFNKVLLGGVTSINTWHGVGLKKVWAARSQTFTYRALHEKNKVIRYFKMLVEQTNRGKTNYVFSTSETVSTFFPETFTLDKSHLPMLGQVRNDVFYKDTIEDENVDDVIRFSKTITYMPTHRNHGLDDPDINNVIDFFSLNKFCHENELLFILKRHMYSKGTIPKGLSNVIDVSEQDIEPQLLLKYTDLLITDYSSCYTDYLLLNRPVIFYPFDLSYYLTHSNEMYFNYEDVTPGPKVHTFEQLLDALKNREAVNKDYLDERTRVRDIFYSKDNQQPVLKKQVEFIKQMVK
ncbi:CDP-glycerol glycerophosphotransferase (TagB/SpsB family) [Alkalihalobacillus xiaoxiensis]|uniref:CDP-glycerol glycerophosphotransferase (TagB/SpsB family) n=1 Tax=Shouchella xiaoxiensis TaxID=766895 RepID=A0ABS2T062_9BACI|nr:CDP-glycerol glycerophosphotransferase family protein [Shouchella xiaoxiensis]MBM7841173.1 CDP-glycerol glycerophosphotransferase (TagB/SpsB family) [Shouchella xiaoxiensis]